MLNWRRWIVPGVITTIGLTAFAMFSSSGPIQRDLTARSMADVRARLGSWAAISFDGRDATVSGEAPTLEAQAGVAPTVAQVWGVRVVKSEAGVLPLQAPYGLSLVKSGETVVVEGFAPTAEERDRLVDLVRAALPKTVVKQELELARGAPAGWTALADFAAKQLGQLKDGSAKISDGTLDLAGLAASGEAYDRVTAALKGALPAGLKLGSVDVKSPVAPAPAPAPADSVVSPYTFGVARSGDGVTLTGHAPDEAARKSLLDQARTLFGKVEIKDELKIGAGAPGAFSTMASGLMQAVSRLIDGSGALSDLKGEIEGAALTTPALADIKAKLDRAFAGAAIDTARLATAVDLPKVAPDECQKLMLDSLARNTVRFETAKATIQETSFGLLDALSSAAMRCPDTRIEISGYTDSDGSDAVNRPLSKARAEAVAGYLVDAGVDRARLTAQGFGADRPVAPNDSPENKALNRRIEFTVSGK